MCSVHWILVMITVLPDAGLRKEIHRVPLSIMSKHIGTINVHSKCQCNLALRL